MQFDRESGHIRRSWIIPFLLIAAGVVIGLIAASEFDWLPNSRAPLRIDEASHCDFEDTTNWRCESVCGPADPARQALIVDRVVQAVRQAVPR